MKVATFVYTSIRSIYLHLYLQMVDKTRFFVCVISLGNRYVTLGTSWSPVFPAVVLTIIAMEISMSYLETACLFYQLKITKLISQSFIFTSGSQRVIPRLAVLVLSGNLLEMEIGGSIYTFLNQNLLVWGPVIYFSIRLFAHDSEVYPSFNLKSFPWIDYNPGIHIGAAQINMVVSS